MAKSAGMTQSEKDQNASRMMISASANVAGLDVAFADGVAASVPWERVREVGGLSDVVAVSLDGPYEALVSTKSGERAEIPWDFARAFGGDACESQMDEAAALGQRKLANRLRDRRRAAGMSRRTLAAASGVDDAALARLETAAQSPKLGVARRIAAALGCPVHSLLMDDDPPTKSRTRRHNEFDAKARRCGYCAVVPHFYPVIPAKAGIQKARTRLGRLRARYVNAPLGARASRPHKPRLRAERPHPSPLP